jgi:hypothetical protein
MPLSIPKNPLQIDPNINCSSKNRCVTYYLKFVQIDSKWKESIKDFDFDFI